MSEKQVVPAEEARHALASAEEMMRAGARAAIPPRWFTFVSAVLIGGLYAAQALPRPGSANAVLLVAIAASAVLVRRHMGAWKRKFAKPVTATEIAGALVIILTFVGLMMGSQVAMEHYGLGWAPVAAGFVAAALVLTVSERARARFERPSAKLSS